MTDILRINPEIFSWTSTSHKVNGIPFNGITGVDFEEKRTRKLVYGARRDGKPLGLTSGRYEPGAVTITMLRDSWDKLETILTALGLGSYGDVPFVYILQYVEPLQLPITLTFDRMFIVGVKESMKEGVDELLADVTCQPLSVAKNGKTLWSQVLRAI